MYKSATLFAVGIGAALAASGAIVRTSILSAAETPTTAPAAPSSTRTHLIKPYSQLTDLSDDEKTQLIAIHEKFNDQKKALDAEEQKEMEGVLTTAQKAELDAVIAKDKAERKKEEAEAREARKKEKAATQP